MKRLIGTTLILTTLTSIGCGPGPSMLFINESSLPTNIIDKNGRKVTLYPEGRHRIEIKKRLLVDWREHEGYGHYDPLVYAIIPETSKYMSHLNLKSKVINWLPYPSNYSRKTNSRIIVITNEMFGYYPIMITLKNKTGYKLKAIINNYITQIEVNDVRKITMPPKSIIFFQETKSSTGLIIMHEKELKITSSTTYIIEKWSNELDIHQEH